MHQNFEDMLLWFQGHLDIVFFVYGLAFVVMGIAIVMQPRKESAFRIADTLWLLAAFGLTHGFNEWLDMWAIIRGRNDALDIVRWFVVVGSYIFLFEFGRRFLVIVHRDAGRGGNSLYLRPWATAAAVVVVIAGGVMAPDFWKTGSTLARYFLCFPGALMGWAGFRFYGRHHRESFENLNVTRYFSWASASLITYGVLGGLVVPKGDFFPANWLNTAVFIDVAHTPVQVFRALAAIVMATSVTGILRIFHWEAREKLQNALKSEQRSRADLERFTHRYQLLLDSVGEGICGLDSTGKATFINSAAVKMTGYTAEDIAGYDLHSLIHHKKPGGATYSRSECSIHKTLVDGEPRLVANEVYWRKDGTSFPVEYLTTPILEEGQVTGAVVIFSDITKRLRLENEKEKMHAQLLQAQKMDAVGVLAAGIAHDFNNMLTIIQGNTDIAMMKLDESNPVRKQLGKVLTTVQRASDLTRQLLLFGRRQALEFNVLNLNQSVENLTKMLNRLIGEDISIQLDLEPELWAVKADAGNMEQVLMNLAINARDAMPAGGEITIKTVNVALSDKNYRDIPYARPGRFVRLSVEDSGAGMDAETLQHIFEPFFSTKAAGKGTGLGLAVVYGIVKQHDGWINADSSPGQGAAFRIYLPAVEVMAQEQQEKKQDAGELRGHGERILLVEDETDLREFAAQALADNAYVVFAAAGVKEALELFEREKGDFHLILSDVALPDGDGVSLVAQLHAGKPGVPVLLCSGYTDSKSKWVVIQERGYKFLQKPYSVKDLFIAIKETLHN